MCYTPRMVARVNKGGNIPGPGEVCIHTGRHHTTTLEHLKSIISTHAKELHAKDKLSVAM